MGDFSPSMLLLAYFNQLTDQVIEDAAQANGLMTVNQLELIVVRGKQMTMKDVAAALRMHPSNITGLVDSCTKAGWVKRVPSKTDKRTKYLVLTDLGANQRKHILQFMESHLKKKSGITDEIATQILSQVKLDEDA